MFTSLLIASLAITTVYTYPARGPHHNDAEIVVVPLEHQLGYNEPDYDNFQGIIDTGYGNNFYSNNGYYPSVQPSYYPWNWNFRGFFGNFDDIFRRMREQAANAWGHVEQPGTLVSRFDDTADDKGNTTSTVKIIDGHKVIINDTVYEKESPFGTSIIKVRVIDVQPLDKNTESPDEVPTTTLQPNSVTTTEKENDIIGTKFNENAESDESDSKNEVDMNAAKVGSPEELENDNEVVSTKDIDDDDDDTAEIIDDEHIEHQNFMHKNLLNHNYQETEYLDHQSNRESFENDDDDDQSNENDLLIDEEFSPIDLSNDIAINDYLEQQGAPVDPDAEIISIENLKPLTSSASSMSFHFPRFETIK